MTSRAPVLLALLVAGCKHPSPPSGFGVNLTVRSSSLATSVRSQIAGATMSVSGDQPTQTLTLQIATHLRSGESRFTYVPVTPSGTLGFRIDALDGNGAVVATGITNDVTLAAGRAVSALVVLGAPQPLPDLGASTGDGGGGECGSGVANGTGCAGATGVCLNGTCCTGCVQNGVCLPGDSNATACGKGGAACFDCTGNSASATCDAGQCSGCDISSCANEGRTCGTSSCGFNCGGCGDTCANGLLSHNACAGKSCQPSGTPSSCDPYAACASATQCATSCTGDALCTAANYCDGNMQCAPRASNTTSCTAGNQCLSGNCVNSVCCSDASCGTCMACNVAGKEGSCQPMDTPTDEPRCPHDAASGCQHNGRCDGAGSCAYYPSSTVCAGAGCTGDFLNFLPPSYCPGGGLACPSQTPQSCGLYKCHGPGVGPMPGPAGCYTDCGICYAGTPCMADNITQSNCASGSGCSMTCASSMCTDVSCH